jgi:predicted RNA-binding protein YlxR (DUF448 family)
MLPGRGAWLCPDPRCFDQALRADSFSRAFKRPMGREAGDAAEEILAHLDERSTSNR